MKKLLISTLLALCGASSFAVQGEMGTGVPSKLYFLNGPTQGASVTGVVSMTSQTVNFPASCSAIWFNSGTIGIDAYKTYTSVLLYAKGSGQAVRLYAQVNHPTGANPGCEADYLELLP